MYTFIYIDVYLRRIDAALFEINVVKPNVSAIATEQTYNQIPEFLVYSKSIINTILT